VFCVITTGHLTGKSIFAENKLRKNDSAVFRQWEEAKEYERAVDCYLKVNRNNADSIKTCSAAWQVFSSAVKMQKAYHLLHWDNMENCFIIIT
jgi:hypothetical protein